jgi:PPK2 family polyphosphate:nucleotide phosphotransferase
MMTSRKTANSSADSWTRYRVTAADASCSLNAIDPTEKPFSSGDKKRDRERIDKLAIELDELQNVFYADRRYRLLIVLQGIDTSGKDGTLRAMFARTTPLGVRTVAWKAPSETERSHDFLWRIHPQVPASGEIVAFNRSHYEDVLVPLVNGDIDTGESRRRHSQINDFERMLAENRTVILKFMLHISKDEQRDRLQARIDDPAKRWKFQRGDIDVRKQWDEYRRAYERAIGATATPWAPWIVVPSDSKTHRNLMVCMAVRDALASLDLRYPDSDPTIARLKVK